jgi:glycerol-3-phosphate dehydrogenase (NAD(P)+)
MKTVAVLGGGSWGTALAVHLARIGHAVRLWAREEDLVARMATGRINDVFLPGVLLPPLVQPCPGFAEALAGAEMVVAAAPSHGTRQVIRAAARWIEPGATIVLATKGLETGSLLRMSQVVTQELGDRRPIVVLSGPSFAVEVAAELPTAVSVASADLGAAMRVQGSFRAQYFRLYATDDVAGVEIGAALKNVIAIAAGVEEGLGLGHNALAALITRGLAEISRLACALGGRAETLAGLSGLGDLVLTCTGSLSRNRRVGMELARGRSLDAILAETKMVAEGVMTTGAALALGARHGVELPIAAKMAEVLAGRRDPRIAVTELMLRPQRIEPEAR